MAATSKAGKRAPETEGRYALFLSLINEHGLSIPDAGKLLGLTKQGSYHLSAKLKREAGNGKVISNQFPDEILRKANRRAKQLLDGKPFGKMTEVRCSTVARLIEKSWDRGYPTRADRQPGDGEFNFTQINIHQYRTDPDARYGVEPVNCREPQGTEPDKTDTKEIDISSLQD